MLKAALIETDKIIPRRVRPVAKPAPKDVLPVPPEVTTVVPDGAVSSVTENSVLGRLLAMARRYQQRGDVNAAMEMYWKLAEDHGGTVEGQAARLALLELAAFDEREGAVHMARAIYERILADVEA